MSDFKLTREQKLQVLSWMLESRLGDLREQSLIRQAKGHFHVAGMGHEAMASLALFLKEEDYLFPFYRDRALALAHARTTYQIGLNFYAKRDSSSSGRQLPGHFSDPDKHMFSVLSPIGAHWLPAVGTAWGLQLDKQEGALVVATVGDGGTRQGEVYEAICFAKEKHLPILFVVEDNGVAISTRTDEMHALGIDAFPKDDWTVVNGCDPIELAHSLHEKTELIRAGGGPQYLWAKVERLSNHSSADDHRKYRSDEELADIATRDPIEVLKASMIDSGELTEGDFDVIHDRLKEQIREDYHKAFAAEDPRFAEEDLNVLAPPEAPGEPILDTNKEYRMADAINETFGELLTDDRTVFFGEDIEDPLGGVFRLTQGLSTKHPEQVFNSPLAEASIIGIACGLAAYGKRPVFEIQFIDFITPAYNQLVNNLANLRWRTDGRWQCPAIIYAPYGAYLPGGGIWHSQSNESTFARVPGLQVVVPSTPEDASGLLLSAQKSQDPVLYLIPKHLLWATHVLPSTLEPVEIGKAAIKQVGERVTLLTWGNGVELAQKALEGFSHPDWVEFIDLRSVYPWDKDLIEESVKKTGRLVIIQEDIAVCSVGQMVIAELVKNPTVWSQLAGPPLLLSRGNVHVPFNEKREYGALPSAEQVVTALNTVLAYQKRHYEGSSEVMDNFVPEKKEVVDSTEEDKNAGQVLLPNLGEGLREARVITLFKEEGDSIAADEAICEVETDKAVFPIESSRAGTLTKWHVAVEAVLEVGDLIAEIS